MRSLPNNIVIQKLRGVGQYWFAKWLLDWRYKLDAASATQKMSISALFLRLKKHLLSWQGKMVDTLLECVLSGKSLSATAAALLK